MDERTFAELRVDDGVLHWIERGPDGGNAGIRRLAYDGDAIALTPPECHVGTTVHGYGGGAYDVAGGVLVYVDRATGAVRIRREESDVPLAHVPETIFADLRLDLANDRVVAIAQARDASGQESDRVVSIALSSPHAIMTLFEDADFLAAPRPSPDGCELAVIAWNAPAMPWTATELVRLPINEAKDRQEFGQDGRQALADPAWGPDGALYALSDREDFWQLHRMRGTKLDRVCEAPFDVGRAQMVLGESQYGFAGDGALIAVATEAGADMLVRINPHGGGWSRIDLPFVEIRHLVVAGMTAFLIAGFADRPRAIVTVDLATGYWRPLHDATAPAEVACAPSRPITVQTRDGGTAHAILFPPDPGTGTLGAASLIVNVHGGPISHRAPAITSDSRYWTARGFTYVELNHRGSTGYGRAYREALYGRWGELDVADAIDLGKQLLRDGLAMPGRMAIRGASAGGATALGVAACASPYAAATSWYGVADYAALAATTHRFERGALDTLIGPWPACAALYQDRSAIGRAAAISIPLLLLQGGRDAVVPPQQARDIHAVLSARGAPVELLLFPEEGHGFGNAAHVRAGLEAEAAFYRRSLVPAPPSAS